MLFANLLDGFLNSNLMGQGIVMAQLAGSVVLFAIIFGKLKALAGAKALAENKASEIMEGEDVLTYHLQRNHNTGSPVEEIYRACCDRLLVLIDPTKRASIARGDSGATTSTALSRYEIGLIQSVCDHTLDVEEIKIEKGMGLIATLVGLEPMLGLLGTVWGVLDAFADIGAAGSANLATMAPAISSALVTTVVGLIIAILGMACDTNLRGKIRDLESTLEGFADDLTRRMAFEFEGRN